MQVARLPSQGVSHPVPHPIGPKAAALPQQLGRLLPGLMLCAAVTVAAVALQALERRGLGRAWLESLVLAILLGTVVRSLWVPDERWQPGITFAAKTLLEVAVMLLGLSLTSGVILAAGPGLLLGIVAVVAVALLASYGIGRVFGLPPRLAVLVACGNSICGNSAIAAAAPVIGAHGDDVAASIAFTALLGVVVVLGLPLLVPALDLSPSQYGVLAGLTVYAVPQVLAATAPVAALSVQVGTLVKLMRVLMLGPVVFSLALASSRFAQAGDTGATACPPVHRLVPWFIVGFLALATARSLGIVPDGLLDPAAVIADGLTVVSMAALSLCTDLRSVTRAGGRVIAAATGSLLLLAAISLGLIHLLGLP
ncbi:MAG: putative sulfate exporter family transporter [Geminicoccaceae bacterium]